MKPLDVIKQGILENNIEMVSKGFAELTGENIEPISAIDVEEDNVVADEPTSSKTATDDSFIAPSKSSEPKHGKKRVARTEAIVAQENQFVDDGEEARDVQTPEYTPSPRTREPTKLIEVSCHICGVKSMLSEATVGGEFYRCENCSRK